jgi:hypothetical protein
MTGTELKGLLEQSNLTVRELSNWLEMEAEQIKNLMELENQKIPLTMAQQVRPLFEQLDA